MDGFRVNERRARWGGETDLVDPQFAHNNIVHRGGDLSPHIVVPTGVEVEVNSTWGGEGEKDAEVRRLSTLNHPFIVSVP